MAELFYEDDAQREAWLIYALAFARFGLWPDGSIETHGPRAPPADRIWGQCEVRTQLGLVFEVTFETASGVAGRDDLTGLLVTDKDRREMFSEMPASKLTSPFKEKIASARDELQEIRNARGGDPRHPPVTRIAPVF